MSSIDNSGEKKRIKEQADLLKNQVIPGPEGVLHGIREYEFNTPIELRQQLDDYWTELKKDNMKPFIPMVTVAVFKNRAKTQAYDEISPFIYEF